MVPRPRFRGSFVEFELIDAFGARFPGELRLTPAMERELRDAAMDWSQRPRLELIARETGWAASADPSSIVDILLAAIRARRLVLLPVDLPTRAFDHTATTVNLLDLVGEAPAPPLDQATPDDLSTSFEVRLVDEIGEALAGVEVTFDHEGIEHPGTTDGDGVARLDVSGISFATVTVTGREAVEDLLRSRWADERPAPTVQPSEDVQVHFMRAAEPITASLVAKTRHTLSLQQDVSLARLIGLHFDPHKSFLLPTTLPNIRAVADLYADHPDAALLVVGHANPGDELDDPDALALERARSVAAYLRDEVEVWLERYGTGLPPARRWGSPEDRLMLKSLPDYPDKPLHENTVRWFQRTRGLSVDGIAGPQTRTQLVTEYMAHDGTSAPGGVSLQVHGGGAHFPLPEPAPEDQAASDRHSDGEHRRVELYAFAEPFGVLPEPSAETSDAGAMEYPQWRQRARTIVDLSAEGSTRRVTLLEMADALFRINSGVVAPEGEDPSADASHPSLATVGLIATVLRYAQDHPDKALLVAGHCDTTASPAFNQPLSEERAQTALAMILGQRQRFAELCHGRHTIADYKQILSWVSRAFDPSTLVTPFDCDPGPIDDVAFTGIEPVRRFQSAYNRNKGSIGADAPDLAEDGAMGSKTWAAMFDCYEHALRLELGIDATPLQARRDALRWVDGDRKALGFSEHHPIDNLGADGYKSQANRRVEILWFDPGEEPNLDQAGGAPQMSEIYLPGRYEREHLDPLTADDLIAVRLCDPQGAPIPEAPYTVTIDRDVHTGTASVDGFIELHVARDATSLVIEWADPREAEPQLSAFTREVILELDDGEAADHRRLTNLGYEGELAEQLEAYQAEFERPSDLDDDVLREEIRAWHDGGERPVATQAAA